MEGRKYSRRNSSLRRESTRRPSFILVGKEEEEQMNEYSYSFISHLGIPILYIIATASVLSGIICMAVISKYWASLNPPMCFLYSDTPSFGPTYQFGGAVSYCYWVAFGAIPPLIVCVACGFIYVLHVRDDKNVTMMTYGCIVAMVLATIFLLAVCCTLSQGLRITYTAKSVNRANNRAISFKEKLDRQVVAHNLPIKTSSMVTASLSAYWIGWSCFALISIFHIALLVRRTSTY